LCDSPSAENSNRGRTAEPKQPPAVSNGKAAVTVEEILALKALVERVGGDDLRTLIAAFER
jgi:hypothetical protein